MGNNREKFLMNYNTSLTLNENFSLLDNLDENIVISNSISPDGRYVILLDELYDIKNKVKIGDVWENFDRLKMYLRHCYNTNKNIPTQLKEEFLNDLKNNLLVESKNDLRSLKPIIKKLLQENWFTDAVGWVGEKAGEAVSWAGEKAGEAVKGIKDFVTTSYEGVKKLVGSISKGEWGEVLKIIGNGVLYALRSLRSAAYHPIGIVVEALVITLTGGAGVPAVAAMWAMIVALDIYEWVSNTGDFAENGPINQMGWLARPLFLGADMLGVVLTGTSAKTAKNTLEPLTNAGTAKEAGTILAKSGKGMFDFLKKFRDFILKGITKLESVLAKLGNSSIAKIINKISGSITTVIKTVVSRIDEVLKIAAKELGIFFGVEQGLKAFLGHGEKSAVKGAEEMGQFFTQEEMNTIISNTNLDNF